MRHRTLAGGPLALAVLVLAAACGSDDRPTPATATAPAGTATAAATGAPSATYSADARTLLVDLGVAQRGLADAIAGGAPLSDGWKQAVAARVSALVAIDERAQKLAPAAAQQEAQAQLLLATRRSREAAETIATAVAEGNISMLERANVLLADAAFQTAAAVAIVPR